MTITSDNLYFEIRNLFRSGNSAEEILLACKAYVEGCEYEKWKTEEEEREEKP